jgi:UDP-glucose 4-epimerase
MAHYLVTGGAGFIGSHIAAALAARGDDVRVFDNFSTGKHSNLAQVPQAEIVEGDLRDRAAVARAVNGMNYVLHHAAMVSVPHSMSDPVSTDAVNVTGTLHVLEAARQAGVQRVVLASSCAVYGDNDELPLKEISQTRPLSPYAASKLTGEILCQTYYRAYGLPTVCLRYFNIYGPRQDPNGEYAAVIPKFAQRLKTGQSPTVFGDGTQTRDFVHVSDVVRANLLACERDGAIGQVLNVASGRGTSLLDLISTLNDLLGASIGPEFAPARSGDIRHSRGDGALIATTLGFRPEMNLVDGLKTIIE